MSFLVASSAFASGNCPGSPNGITPGTSTTPGITPSYEVMPCIMQGNNMYDTLYFTCFSSYGGQTVDSLTIDSISGLPAGLCWNTSKTQNVFLGGEAGVIQIFGSTVATAGQYRLDIHIHVVAGAVVISNPDTFGVITYYLRVTCSNTCITLDTTLGSTTAFIADTTACLNPFSVSINPNQLSTICSGQGIVLGASASTSPVTYLWSNGATGDTTAAFPTVSTTYGLTVTDGNGNIVTDSIYITVIPSPTAAFTLQPTSTPHVWDILSQNTDTNTIYIWSWGDGVTTTTLFDTTSHTYDSAGYYSVCLYLSDSVTGCASSYCDTSVYLFKDGAAQMIQVNVIPQTPTGITSVTAPEQQISYYGGEVHFSEMVTAPADVRLYDLSGREVMRQNNFTGNTLPLNGNISQGVYIISLQNNTYSLSRKLAILQ